MCWEVSLNKFAHGPRRWVKSIDIADREPSHGNPAWNEPRDIANMSRPHKILCSKGIGKPAGPFRVGPARSLPKGQELRTALLFNFAKSICYLAQGLLPGDTLPSIFSPLSQPLQRMFQAIRVVGGFRGGLSFWANISSAGGAAGIAGDLDHTASLQVTRTWQTPWQPLQAVRTTWVFKDISIPLVYDLALWSIHGHNRTPNPKKELLWWTCNCLRYYFYNCYNPNWA